MSNQEAIQLVMEAFEPLEIDDLFNYIPHCMQLNAGAGVNTGCSIDACLPVYPVEIKQTCTCTER